MEVRPKKFTYRTGIRWSGEKRGALSAAGKPDLEVATPPEFKGHPGVWSPEDLFVSSINACVMSTFLAFAERAGFAFTAYASEAEGTAELVEGKLQFTSVAVKPNVTLAAGGDEGKAKELLAKAEAHCLVSNSLKTKISLEPTITLS